MEKDLLEQGIAITTKINSLKEHLTTLQNKRVVCSQSGLTIIVNGSSSNVTLQDEYMPIDLKCYLDFYEAKVKGRIIALEDEFSHL